MSILVKDAELHDLDNINQLLRLAKLHRGYEEKFLDRFMNKLGISASDLQTHPPQLFYKNNTLIGFYNFIHHDDGTLELDHFYIHPEYHHNGIDLDMWKTCCDNAKNKYSRNEFIIWNDPHTETFYLQMGCKKSDENPGVMKFCL